MALHSTGSGEPDRTLALLWRHVVPLPAPRKGPLRSGSVDLVVDAALQLADEAGLSGVTMRAVAERAGWGTMSVYTYVPDKASLIDLMVDTLYLRMERPGWSANARWRERLTRVAEANLALLTAHPWLTEVAVLSRPPLGPGLMAKYEHELAAFDGTGLAEVDLDAALTFLLGFVHGQARAAHDASRVTTDSAVSDLEWWTANQPLLERAFDPAAYPRAARVGAAAGQAQGAAWAAEPAWSFGLARVLDGLATLVEPEAARAPDRRTGPDARR